MNRDKMIEKLLREYSKYNVTLEEITYMVDAGFDHELDPDYIMQNIILQLNEEYKGD